MLRDIHYLATLCPTNQCNLHSGEGERVTLGKNPLKARGSVEQWLGSVESGMASSLRRLTKQAMATYPEETRTEWLLQQPAQLVLAVSQVYWVAAVEAALRSGEPQQGLQDYFQVRLGASQDMLQLLRTR